MTVDVKLQGSKENEDGDVEKQSKAPKTGKEDYANLEECGTPKVDLNGLSTE